MATPFETMVRVEPRFEVPVRARFGLVFFRLRPINDGMDEATMNELNRRLLEAVNAMRRTYMSCTVVGGMYVMRCAIGNSLTKERHVWEAAGKGVYGDPKIEFRCFRS